ncbi:VIT domain-containing protein [Nannocystaceae bacterium ST9]
MRSRKPSNFCSRRLFPAPLALSLLVPFVACQSTPGSEGQGDGNSASAEVEAAKGPAVATITKIRGERGITAPDLPAGAFLGEGAALHAGQWIELPRGTRAELELASGQRLRIDEDSRLRLPDSLAPESPAKLELTRGRLIVLADVPVGSPPGPKLEVVAADDRLVVERGEVELRAGETRHYGVVSGHSILHTAGREIPLGPGASISTPAAPDTRPETPPDPTILAAAFTPQLSLAPLDDTAWAAAFEDTAKIADDLPQGVGSLVAKRAGSSVEKQSLRLTEQKVAVTISGRIARTEIEQAFHNDSAQVLEGIYQFPLPADASISDLQLLVGDEWIRGEMLEKQRARSIFRQIVDATVPRDPALLQWEEGSVFKLNIFPIPGKGERRIKIAYTQVLPAVGDALRYRYPMGGSGATATEIGDFQFGVTVDGRELDEAALAAVSTPMAELARTREGTLLRMSMQEHDFRPTHELGVDVPLAKDERRVIAATHRDKDAQGYFMLTLRPDLQLRADPRPVHYAFVLDRSHGTSPELWTAAEGLTKAVLTTLEPQDRFTILACDTACDRLEGGMRGRESTVAGDLDGFFDRQVLAGASDIGNMLRRAGAVLEEGDGVADVERVVVYLGDGVATSGALTPDELGSMASKLGRVRVQAVALGSRSDTLLLDHLTRTTGGDLLQADARDDLDRLARELRLRAQVPVAHDLVAELPPGLIDVHPKQLPALRPGDTITLVGKLAEGDPKALRGDVRLRGQGPSGTVDESFQIMLDAEYSNDDVGVHAHLPRTWAQQEIAHLTQTEGAAAEDRIVQLSRDYNVLSRFTALLVLENDRMFKEFGVDRKAGNKDGWTSPVVPGQVPSPDPASAADTTTTPTETPNAAPAGGSGKAAEQAESEPTDKGGGEFFDPPSPSADERRDRSSNFEDEGFSGGDDFFEGDAIGGSETKSGGGAGRGSGGFAPPPPEKSKKQASESSASKPKPGIDDGISWEEQQWDRPRHKHWISTVVVREASGPSSADLQAIAGLEARVKLDPSDRKAHRELVRRAIRSGDRNALSFASAWAAADPDHAPALLAHADLLAAAGDPLALRAYDSALEVEPFSTKLHRRMADALRSAGDFERSCSHRRALVSIDPQDAAAAADLFECLVEAGRSVEAREQLAEARERLGSKAGKTLANAEKKLVDGVQRKPAGLHGSDAALRATLRWSAAENLDLAFVDSKARRLSVMRPELIRVREELDGGQRVETMTLREVDGTLFVEVTRPRTTSEDAIDAVLELTTIEGKKRFDLKLEPGTRRVALVKIEQRMVSF